VNADPYERAITLVKAGDLDASEKICRRLLKSSPHRGDCLHLLGVVELRRGHARKAAELINRSLATRPDDAAAHSNLGHALINLRRLHEALTSFDHAVALNPGLAVTHNSRAIVLSRLERFDEALAALDGALSIDPHFAEALNNRGNVLKALGRNAEALASFERCLAGQPDFAQAYHNRATVLIDMQRFDAAFESADRAVDLMAGNAEAWNTRGLALMHLKRFDEALADFQRALALQPRLAQALNNRALTLTPLRRFDEALASFEEALAINPGFAEAHWAQGMLRLLLGDFERGWTKYEWRWKWSSHTSPQPNFTQPQWLGKEPLKGKRILLHAEQGLGDTLQFCRYAAHVAQRGAHVMLEVQPSLKALLGSLVGPEQLVAKGEPLPPFDVQCPLMSLPLALGTSLSTIPATIPYLRANPEHIERWKDRLGTRRGPRVGIAWSGNPQHKNDHNRSLSLAALIPLDALDVELYSLQPDMRPSDRAAFAEFRHLRHFGSELSDFADTAALASLMDVVISVDTAVAHLAGALGRPVWVLLHHTPEWRWLLDRVDSPWYPTARLLRQPSFDDWTSVVTQLVKDVSALCPGADTTAAFVSPPGGLYVQARSDPASTAHTAPSPTRSNSLSEQVRQAATLFNLGKLPEAAGICDEILSVHPTHADIVFLAGVIKSRLGETEHAASLITRSLVLKPNSAVANNSLGEILMRLGRMEKALASFDRSLRLDARNASVHNNRAIVLMNLGRFSEAVPSIDRAMTLDPDFPEALNTRATLLRRGNRHEEALADCDHAVRVKPGYAEAYCNRGAVLQDLGRREEACASYARAQALDPRHAEAYVSEALCRLAMGHFDRGWEKHEWRWKCSSYTSARRDFEQPLWLGDRQVSGKTILLHAEQGLGDTLQFCRYATLVARQGAEVVLEVQPALKTLLTSLDGPAIVVAQGDALPAFDLHCPLMSLPLATRTTVGTIPAAIPYLAPPADRVRAWQARLGAKRRLRVGLAWSGNPLHRNDHNRSLPLARLKPLDALDGELYSLQPDVRPSDRAALETFCKLRHFGDDLGDFADTAALASLMDVVISVDTAVAHLAGALGRPVWILLPHASEWRWLLDRADSPWYPTAQLFRQPAFDDWGGVIRAITAAAAVLASQAATPHAAIEPSPSR